MTQHVYHNYIIQTRRISNIARITLSNYLTYPSSSLLLESGIRTPFFFVIYIFPSRKWKYIVPAKVKYIFKSWQFTRFVKTEIRLSFFFIQTSTYSKNRTVLWLFRYYELSFIFFYVLGNSTINCVYVCTCMKNIDYYILLYLRWDAYLTVALHTM